QAGANTNQIYVSLLDDPVKTGNNDHNDNTHDTHYSVLKTVKDNWNLGSVRNAKTANSVVKSSRRCK
ncbi:11876_t:CDS:1, partial [Scutellospora calospora]